MEEVNKQFIKNKLNTGNEFISTVDPTDKTYLTGSFAKEIQWIKELTGGTWRSIGDNLWKLIR